MIKCLCVCYYAYIIYVVNSINKYNSMNMNIKSIQTSTMFPLKQLISHV